MRELALHLSIWTAFGLFSALVIYVEARSRGNVTGWWRILLRVMPYWYFWALSAPLLFRIGQKFPLEKYSLWRVVFLHFFIGLGWMLVYGVLGVSYEIWLTGVSFSEFPARLRGALGMPMLMDSFCYALLVVAGYAVQFYRRSCQHEAITAQLQLEKAQLETRLTQAQLDALRAQLHPHFLFNTLNTIAALVRQDDKAKAIQMLATLGELLRRTIDQRQGHFITLREELDFLHRYLDLQRMRYPDRLRIEMQVAPDAVATMIPNLLLQPLVENAVRHGIAESLQPGSLQIHVRRDRDRLCLAVYNDGPLLPAHWNLAQHSGVGLSNTQARLAKLYGDDFYFALSNVDGKGVLARLEIPVQPVNRLAA